MVEQLESFEKGDLQASPIEVVVCSERLGLDQLGRGSTHRDWVEAMMEEVMKDEREREREGREKEREGEKRREKEKEETTRRSRLSAERAHNLS
jgi:hypothetical protein